VSVPEYDHPTRSYMRGGVSLRDQISKLQTMGNDQAAFQHGGEVRKRDVK
jgi:hypothetical protein